MIENGYHDVPAGKLVAAVTHLEMHAPAPLRAVPTPAGLTFGPAKRDIASYRDLFARVGAEWLWHSRLTKSDAALETIFADPNVEIFTLSRNGVEEALLELDFNQGAACELSFFGLARPLIGSGAGRYLMNQAITRAWAKPIKRFHLHTCTFDSPQALAFYMRSGFTPYRRQFEIVDDPRLSGALPKSAAPHVPLIAT